MNMAIPYAYASKIQSHIKRNVGVVDSCAIMNVSMQNLL